MTGGESLDDVVAAVRTRIEPDETERETLQRTARELVLRAEAVVEDLGVAADVVQVGSTARGTWVSGDRDIDIFVRFDPSTSREDLERYGLTIGNRVLPDGREEYAEHPYVSGELDGFDVDLVPCYRVDRASDIKSSVDRTPFHNAYLADRIDDDLATEVLLFKQFLKGIGAYGSDLKTRGFSGYLTELLVLEYGGFESVLDAATTWRPPIELDPEDHGTTSFDDPLTVIDPTDPKRNVAAVVAAENVASVQHHAREFLADPDEETFFPPDTEPLSPSALETHLETRDSTIIAVRFDAPDLVPDQLYPQLRRSLDGLVRGLEDHGFDVLRADTFADDSAVLFVELSVASLPAVERHEGPPVFVEAHAQDFLERYRDSPAYGPFIDGDRYVVERQRVVTTARQFVDERLLEVALGARVETALETEYEVLEGEAIQELLPEFGLELARYYDPRP